ncbi:MAG TPA: DNA adenine methylase [Thiobacillaceae bacterium]|nr:DNA adenine methylase [Thiobacillaceae bacterium]
MQDTINNAPIRQSARFENNIHPAAHWLGNTCSNKQGNQLDYGKPDIRGRFKAFSIEEAGRGQDRRPNTSYSPLRYPGGKSRAVKYILPLIGGRTKTLVSPFFGGGAIELAAARHGIQVQGFDIFEPLVDFWHCALTDPKTLADRVSQFYPMSHERFQNLQAHCEGLEGLERAAAFYVLNRASFSGLTLSGGMAGPNDTRFTPTAISKLARFECPNLLVQRADFRESLSAFPAEFTYLDPPYLLKKSNLYGVRGGAHKHFNHAALAALLRQRKAHWLSARV